VIGCSYCRDSEFTAKERRERKEAGEERQFGQLI